MIKPDPSDSTGELMFRPMQVVLRVVLVLGIVSCSDSPTQLNGLREFTAVVANNELHLTLPLLGRVTWEWDQASASDGELEYKWTGTLINGGEEYEVGFFKWKFPGTASQSGTFEQLLQDGQTSIFRLDPSGGPSTLVQSGQATAYSDADSVVIRVNDPATFALLTSQHPSEVTLTRTERGQATLSQTVLVNYEP
jgi:hypothetical protein